MPTRKRAHKSNKIRKLQLLRFYVLSTVVGFICLLLGIFLLFNNNQLSYANNVSIKQNTPVRLNIPKIRLSLPIVEAEMINNQWQISEKEVNHLSSSANPGEVNNIVIYGHNKWEILGRITQVNLGDEIDLFTQDGQIHIYVVFEKKEVNQYAVGFIKPSNQEILTIFTCSGWFDSKRLIVQAKRK